MKLVGKTAEELKEMAKDNNLPEFVIRIKQEADELEKKIDKLKAFFDTSQYLLLSPYERGLLTKQYRSMAEYLGVLNERYSYYYTNKRN